MKEKLENILNDETIETVTEKVDAIAKEIAKLTVPKDKYNRMSERAQTLKIEKEEIQEELDEIKDKNLSVEEKQNKDLEKAQNDLLSLKLELNKTKAREIFKNANISDDKIEGLVEKVVSEDTDKVVALAQSFAEVLTEKVTDTKKQTQNDLLVNTPKPQTKESNNAYKEIKKEDFLKMSYGEKKELYILDKNLFNQLNSEI